jgi:5-(carboxyamino)imidazole ribonucleotide mutase
VPQKVLIVMGSDSDFDQITPAWKVLESLGVAYEVTVASAHRSPERVVALARAARDSGYGVILAAAGGAAHLAGVIAANTTLPVVAVPVVVGSLGGVDALLSAVQMPGGVPIASVGIGGARNAGYFAAAILSASDPEIAGRIEAFRAEQAKNVEVQDGRVQQKLGRALPERS